MFPHYCFCSLNLPILVFCVNIKVVEVFCLGVYAMCGVEKFEVCLKKPHHLEKCGVYFGFMISFSGIMFCTHHLVSPSNSVSMWVNFQLFQIYRLQFRGDFGATTCSELNCNFKICVTKFEKEHFGKVLFYLNFVSLPHHIPICIPGKSRSNTCWTKVVFPVEYCPTNITIGLARKSASL